MQKTLVVVQDGFLNQLRKESVPVRLNLLNGLDFCGLIKAFDSFVLMMEDEKGKQTMVYKHAVTSIACDADAGTTE
jgi:host factor-I protein